MVQIIKYGNKSIERETVLDVERLFQHDGFLDMVRRAVTTIIEHAASYPLLDKERKVTVTLSYKPVASIDQQTRELVYRKGVYKVAVGSPALPTTEVPFTCEIGPKGMPFFNVDDPANPMQLTFRDAGYMDDDATVVVTDGKNAAIKG